MNIFAFILFLFGLQAICLIVGRMSSKNLKNQEDYFLAGKSVRFFPLMMTFVATQVGGGLILGSAEEAFQFGWAVLLYPLGASLGLIILGLGLGRKLAQFNVSTIAQLFEVVYNSPNLKKLTSVLSIISLFLILIAQVIASSKFMISLGVDSKVWFLAFWAMVIVYTAMGGLKAVVATDIVQAGFFVTAFIICFGFISYFSDISFGQVIDLGFAGQDVSFSASKLCGWLLMPLLFMVIEQDMAQRCLAADSPKTVSKAALCAAGFTMVICMIPVYLGVLAKQMGLETPAGGSVLMTVIEYTSTPVMTAMVGCAILAAIISTADSLINAISSNLSQDFNISYFKKDNIVLTQASTALIAILALGSSFYFSNVVDLLILSYELSVSCLFVPIFIALFKREGNKMSAVLSILFGAGAFVLFRVVPMEFPKEVASILLSGVGFGLGELIVWVSGLKKEEAVPQGGSS